MRVAISLLAVGLLVACGSDEEPTAEITTTTTSQVVTTIERTPEPSAEQAATIETQVAAIYPGVPEGKAADWARSTCFDKLRDGLDDDRLVERIGFRYAGGDRPDPTSEQAEQILEIILAGGWCQ